MYFKEDKKKIKPWINFLFTLTSMQLKAGQKEADIAKAKTRSSESDGRSDSTDCLDL